MTGRGGAWRGVRGLAALCLLLPRPAAALGLPTQSWPAGTFLSWVPESGQVTTFHRGVLYLGGLSKTTYYDISNPIAPVKLREFPGGADGHLWWKLGDLFYRDFFVPGAQSAGRRFLDLSDPVQPAPWTKAAPLIDLSTGTILSDIRTFPHVYDAVGKKIYDVRTGLATADFNFEALKGHSSPLSLRIGNLWFFVAREGFGDGLSVFDVGDPSSPRLLDVLHDDFRQYTAFFGVWRNHVIFMHGDNTNGNNNLVAVDFSDPSDLKVAFRLAEGAVTSSRYANFQDQYLFTARFNRAVKFNMETLQVEREIPMPSPDRPFPDFQAVPLGHLLLISGQEGLQKGTFLYTHQDGPDVTPPSLGHHVPANGATGLPVETVVGLVINETLDDTTLTDQTIQIIPAGGAPIAADVVSGQHNVINVAPRRPLMPNTPYEVRLPAGGVKDVAGNGIALTTFTFTTGSTAARAPQITGITLDQPSPAAQGSMVAFSADASDADGDALEYRWDFGDGTAADWNASSGTAHAYGASGSYQVLAQVRDGTGFSSGFSRGLVVKSAAADPSMSAQDARGRARSTPVAVDGARRKVWVVNPDSDTVAVVDADALVKLQEISVGKRPMSVAVDPQGRAWVACRDSDEVRVLTASGGPVGTLTLPRGSRPVAVALNPAGTQAYVAAYATGRVHRYDAGTLGDMGSLSVGPTPKALAVTDDGGRLLVSRFISPAAAGEVYAVNLPGFIAGPSLSLPMDSAGTDTAASGRGLPNYVAGLALAPGSDRGWYAAKKDNVLRGLSRDGAPLTHDSSVRALVGTFLPGTNVEETATRVDIDNNAQPSAVAVDPYGATVLVTLEGNARVVALDRRTGLELARAETGPAPEGVAVDAATHRIFVQNLMGRSVTVLDGSGLILDGEKTIPLLQTVSTVAVETFPPQVLQGKKVFYNAEDPRMSLEGYISCAVCHVDGGHDGRTWDFTDRGEGLRNTIPLRGRAGTAQGRVHWSGNFDEIQDFEHDVRGAFGGTGFMGQAFTGGTRSDPLGDPKAGFSAELDALAAYVMSLAETAPSPFKNADGSMTAQGVAGEALFRGLSCHVCHGGSAFTDSSRGLLHDVGTIKPASGRRLNGNLLGLDTPTLKGLWDTAPYLHDGSAATLRDVMNDPSHMGGALTEGEKDLLVEYLLQLDDLEAGPETPALIEMTVTPVGNPAERTFEGRITLRNGLAAPQMVVDGVLAGAAGLQEDGTYLATVTVGAGNHVLMARGTRPGGGASYSLETRVLTPQGPVTPAVSETPEDRKLLTPGGDGINDLLEFGPEAQEVEIMNARGRLVHRAAGSSPSWDGRIGGRPASAGLYVAKIRRWDGTLKVQKILIVK